MNAPIIEINWLSILLLVGMIAIAAGVGLLIIKGAVAIVKREWKREE